MFLYFSVRHSLTVRRKGEGLSHFWEQWHCRVASVRVWPLPLAVQTLEESPEVAVGAEDRPPRAPICLVQDIQCQEVQVTNWSRFEPHLQLSKEKPQREKMLPHLESYRAAQHFGVSQLVIGRSDSTVWLAGVFVSGRASLTQPSLTREINMLPDPIPSFCCPAAT